MGYIQKQIGAKGGVHTLEKVENQWYKEVMGFLIISLI